MTSVGVVLTTVPEFSLSVTGLFTVMDVAPIVVIHKAMVKEGCNEVKHSAKEAAPTCAKRWNGVVLFQDGNGS
jgi:hypothetical protein